MHQLRILTGHYEGHLPRVQLMCVIGVPFRKWSRRRIVHQLHILTGHYEGHLPRVQLMCVIGVCFLKVARACYSVSITYTNLDIMRVGLARTVYIHRI